MGILNLLTNPPQNFKFYSDKGYVGNGETSGMKSYKFGKDRPGGGSSNQPYVKNPIQIDIKNPSFYNDFILRGGILAPIAAANDVIRLSKYFIDLQNPNGILFTAKQNLLSRIGTKTESSKGLGYAGGALNEGIYTPLSTLAEAGIIWAGGHVNKQGLDPTGLFAFASIKKYEDIAAENNKEITNSAPPTVPESLYRKEDRANIRESNRIKATEKQRDKTIHEVKYRPKTQVNLPDIGDVSSADKNKFSLNKLENKINTFLQKWDTYRDEQAGKRLDRKERREGAANERSETATNNRIEGEFYAQNIARKVYSNRLLSLWDTKGLNLSYPAIGLDPILYSYGGGPNSVLGIGSTNIRFATSNTGEILRTGVNMVNPYIQYGRRLVEYKTTNIFGKTFMPDSYGSVSLTYAGRYNTSTTEEALFGTSDYLVSYNDANNIQPFDSNNIWFNSKNNFSTWDQLDLNTQTLNRNSDTKEDFRSQLSIPDTLNNTFLSVSPSYIDNNIETKFGLQSPGTKGNRSSYTIGKRNTTDGALLGPIDKINASSIYKTNTKDGSKYGKEGGEDLADIVPFFIAILNNDSQVGGTYKKYMHFRAFIDSFSDTYAAEWNPIEYMGRAEKFYKYGGFDRKITMAFTIVAQSREEITIMYDKLNFLASSLAPEYLDSYTSGYMAGNIAYITLGGYLDDQPGVITSLTFDVPEESPWEIGIDDFGKRLPIEDIRQLPHMIRVTGINFIPIHKFRPEKQSFRNDKLGTDSTRLLNTGKQRYIDQLRPESTNYDKEFQEKYTTELKAESDAENIKLQNTQDFENAQAILLQSNENLNILTNQPTPTNVNTVLGNQQSQFTPSTSLIN